ncbi:MAG: ATP-binding protein [Proteobacteria bacterium]|nr:ATP-binding protein [Pseudomonadota bacterium]
MKLPLINDIERLNPWLKDPKKPILDLENYIQRIQTTKLLQPDWDTLWLVLVGPRQAGKTTLGKYICHQLIQEGRFKQLLYLNCDFKTIREWLINPLDVIEALEYFQLEQPILFIDEVQRLETPGLLLKSIADLKLPIKMIASGSSQLEIKSKVQEYLTGRHLESLILPLSYSEIEKINHEQLLIFGCYPQIIQTQEKSLLLKQLYRDYINKDIIEILKIGMPDVIEKLITLIAHSSGQLVNYNQLATDCSASIATIKNYLSILEKTYVLQKINPFVGNKRTEITSNPVYYFIDNGFRNQALSNFLELDSRGDVGMLVQGFAFQEIYKTQSQYFKDFTIHFWRTKSGAEVDFILKQGTLLLPIEIKYRHMNGAAISRSFRSFIQAYEPKDGIYITKDFYGKIKVDGCTVHFIPLSKIDIMKKMINTIFS